MNWPLLLACPVLHVRALNIYLAGGWKISGLNQIILWIGFDLLNVRLSKLSSLVPASAESFGCIHYEEEKITFRPYTRFSLSPKNDDYDS